MAGIAGQYLALFDELREFYWERESTASALSRARLILTALACTNIMSGATICEMLANHQISRIDFWRFDSPLGISLLVVSYWVHAMIARKHPFVPRGGDSAKRPMAYRAKFYLTFSAVFFAASIVAIVLLTKR
jgi:hypothetical protein